MKKIPLEATIIDAYKFFFHNIISIIGTVWFPVVVFVGVLGALLASIVPHEWLAGHFVAPQNPEAFFLSRRGLIVAAETVVVPVGLLVSAMIRVGILRLAVGEKSGLTLFWFSLGAKVWRMIGAMLLTVIGCIVVVAIAVGAVVLAYCVLHAIPHLSNAVTVLVTVLLAIAAIVGIVYVLVRQFFFLPAVIVAENKIGLKRSWALGKGNVWCAIVIWLAVVIPVSMITGIITNATLMPAFMTQAAHLGPNPPPAEMMGLFTALLPLLPVIIAIELLSGLVILGTMLGAVGKAYKAVTVDETA
jgi:hypothetical protein